MLHYEVVTATIVLINTRTISAAQVAWKCAIYNFTANGTQGYWFYKFERSNLVLFWRANL